MQPLDLNRRAFLASAAALSAAFTSRSLLAQQTASPPVCVFSKHLQFLDYKTLARTCKEIGLDGVDLTVRAGGHVLPENVARDLPAAVEAIRAEGLEVPMITTRLLRADEQHAEEVIKTAAVLGIKYFRVGSHKYDMNAPIQDQIARVTEECRSLAELGARHGLSAGYHNHSGPDNFGAPLWDLWQVCHALQSPHFGSNFDFGHASAEGPFGDWKITLRLLAPHVKMTAVKDFVFEKNKPRWVPLGEGIVPFKEMFRILRATSFSGPVSIHVEYDIESDDAMIAAIAQAATRIRGEIAAAGY